jgi:hypothetical protein
VTGERLESAVAIAQQLLDLCVQSGIRLAPVEDRHRVPSFESNLDNVPPEKDCSAEDENLHRLPSLG